MSSLRDLIRRDHQTIETLFAHVSGTGGAVERERLFAQLQHELRLHSQAEERALYPELRQHVETRLAVDDVMQDHAEMLRLAKDIAMARKDHPDLAWKCRDLRQMVEQHLRDEEDALIPAAAAALRPERLTQMTRRFQAEKQSAET
jgi:hemerythrin superfamily protein